MTKPPRFEWPLAFVVGLALIGLAACAAPPAGPDRAAAIPDAATQAATGPEALRVVVRPAAYVESLRKAAQANPDAAPVAVPFAGPLEVVAVLDFPRSVGVVQRATLQRLGLSDAEAMARARANTRAALAPLSQVARPLPLPPRSIGTLTGHGFYESSRLADHAAWEPIARGAEGQLLVLAPEIGTVLYTDSAQPNALIALLALGTLAAREAERPLPLVVLAWSRDGWQVVPAPPPRS
jgi:hypothetical protein